MQVVSNLLVQNLFGKHPLSRSIHNILVVYLLVEIHSGYDLPFHFHNLFPPVFAGTVRIGYIR